MFLRLLACTCVAALRLPTPLRRGPKPGKPRVAVLGGGFAGLTAARRLKRCRAIGEVVLLDQRRYFEYTPGILRAWVDAHEHRRLVKPLAKLFRGRRATFARVAPGAAAKITHADDALTLDVGAAGSDGHVSIRCDYAVLATGASLAPISDDRLHAGSVASRRERLEAQVAAVLRPNVTSALVVGGGLTGVELAAELAEYFGGDGPRAAAAAAQPARRRVSLGRASSLSRNSFERFVFFGETWSYDSCLFFSRFFVQFLSFLASLLDCAATPPTLWLPCGRPAGCVSG